VRGALLKSDFAAPRITATTNMQAPQRQLGQETHQRIKSPGRKKFIAFWYDVNYF
jgi:hypothetical protein